MGLLVQGAGDGARRAAKISARGMTASQRLVTDARPSRRQAGVHPRRLNVPQDDAGNITDDTRIRASVPGIRARARRRGAAVMVTSHLGPAHRRQARARRFAGAGREAPLRAARHARCRSCATGWTAASQVKPGRGGAARELPLQQGREEERRGARAQDGGALRRLRERRVRHGAPRGGDHARHREVRADRVRRAADGGGARRARARRSSNPARPLVAIVAGSKVSTKLTILESLAAKVDQLIVGGGIANTFLLAAGMPIGKSLAEPELEGRGAGDHRHDESARRGSAASRPTSSWPSDLAAQARANRVAVDRGQARRHDPRHRPASRGAARGDHRASRHHRLERSGRRVRVRPVRRRHEGRSRYAIAGSKAFSIAGGGDTLAAIAKFGIADKISLHLDRRRRVPRVPGRQEAAGGRDPRAAGCRIVKAPAARSEPATGLQRVTPASNFSNPYRTPG